MVTNVADRPIKMISRAEKYFRFVLLNSCVGPDNNSLVSFLSVSFGFPGVGQLFDELEGRLEATRDCHHLKTL